MKNLKKLASVALALVMAMALMAPAFAAESATPSIKITNAYPGNTYKAYKIFDLESYNDETQSYKIASGWLEFFTNGAGKNTVEGIGADKNNLNGYVTWVGPKTDSSELANFAKAALEYAENNKIGAAAQASSSTRTDENYNKTEVVTIALNDFGWYLVDSSNGALCSLNATTPVAEIAEKNPAPSITKTSDNTESTKQIGDTVTFTINVKAQKGAQAYVVHDVMGAGLALNANSITVAPAAAAAAATVTTTGLADGCTFEVSFAQDYLNTITEETDITITYSAVITADALTQQIGNKAQLKYGDNDFTPWSEVGNQPNDGVYDFDLVKTTSNDTVLEGAQFTLTRKDASNADEIVWFLKSGRDYTVCAAGTTGAVSTIDAGNVRINGLGAVVYTLTETKAPDGYNALTAPVSVDMTGKADQNAIVNGDTYVSGGIEVENLTGAELPATGGMGTTIFYAVGGVLLAGSAILFITKKRMGE